MMELLSENITDHGICLIDVYCAPGDLYDSWDIVPIDSSGNFPRIPDAGYGPDCNDRDVRSIHFEPVKITEVCKTWHQNGWRYEEVVIFADGRIAASRIY